MEFQDLQLQITPRRATVTSVENWAIGPTSVLTTSQFDTRLTNILVPAPIVVGMDFAGLALTNISTGVPYHHHRVLVPPRKLRTKHSTGVTNARDGLQLILLLRIPVNVNQVLVPISALCHMILLSGCLIFHQPTSSFCPLLLISTSY